MPQIQAGFNYTPTGANSLVTAGNMNQHVNNAQLLGGAISEQVLNSVTADTDFLLIGKGGNLFKQTKLQFTDTINSETINVNELSVDTAQIDNLTLAPVVSGSYAPVLDLRGTNIVASGSYSQIRFGYSAWTGNPPTGSSWLNSVEFATRNVQIYNPNYSASGRAQLQVVGRVDIINSTGVTTDAELNVDGNVTISGNVVIDGTLTVATANPSLKASGSWTWDGTNLNQRRAPFNCSVTRLGVGYYRVNFTTPMATPNYVISALTTQATGNANISVGELGIRTSSEFYLQVQIKAFSSSGGPNDGNLDILVFD